MKAVILVGGEATRLKPLTPTVPKAMVPVLNVCFLEYVFRHLSAHGINEIILTQSHFARPINDYFGDGARVGIKLRYVIEEVPLGTAGAIRNSADFLDDTFLVLNGDIITDLDLSALIRYHRENHARVTITLTPVDDPTKYGLIECDRHGRVTRFLEKPKPEEVTTNTINAGTYVIEPEVLEWIPAHKKVSIERETFPALVSEDIPVFAFNSDAYWIDMGTPEKYLQLNRDILRGATKFHQPPGDKLNLGRDTVLAPGVGSDGEILLGDRVNIAAGVRLRGPLVMGHDNRVAENTALETSVIWNGVSIGADAVVKDSIVADGCVLGDGCRLDGAVLGHGVELAPGTVLEPGARLPDNGR